MTNREDHHRATPAPPSPGAGPAVEEAEPFLARLEGLFAAGSRVLARGDAVALDALAAACARGGGAFELAVGEGLDLLARSGGDVRLGYSGVGDLARERLGLAPWQARRLRRNAVALRARPLLRAAVVSGEVSARKAEVMLPVAVGAGEAYWAQRARVDTVRRLEAAAAGLGPAEDDWHRIRLALPRVQAEIVDGAIEVAKVVMGPATPLWKRLWAIAAEYLSTHPVDPLEAITSPRDARPAAGSGSASSPSPRRRSAHGCLSLAPGVEQGDGPAAGDAGQPEARQPQGSAARNSPPAKAPGPEPYDVLDRLLRLVTDRAAADERLGRACLLAKRFGVARQLGWSCFEEWCQERLGLAPSTVYQRIALERRLALLPELRQALRSRRLSYEQARLVARVATPSDVAGRIAQAAGKPCIALVRELEAEARLQMCDAGELRAVVPEDVESMLEDAIRAARLHAGRPLTPGEALVEVARHFLLTWMGEAFRLLKDADPVVLRDQGLCRIPGCSRAADHVHHVRFRSAGGPLEEWNELSVCAPHHLLGVHGGSVLVRGRAPDGLSFVLGEKDVAAARA